MDWKQSRPLSPRPVPTECIVPAIGYFKEAGATEPWSRLVNWVGIVGLGLAGADAVWMMLQLLPAVGGPTLRPFGLPLNLRGMLLLYMTAGWLTSGVLLAGSIASLARARLGRVLMLVYVVAAVGQASLSAIWYLSSVSEPGMLIAYLLQSLRQVAFPAVVMAVMRQPPVRRLFDPR
jgi:hypothetical protein